MKALATLLCSWLLFGLTKAAEPDFSKMTDEQLVDSLQLIKEETVGIMSLAAANAFLAENKPAKFAGGVLGSPSPVMYPQMRLLVQHGIQALPVLLKHLDDARPTQLAIDPHGIIMWSQMDEEYAPRVPDPNEKLTGETNRNLEVKFPYAVKVGDVCFVLIGQIVGRPLNAARYQPTGGMIVNSPVESKKLAEQVRKDWDGITEAEFREQLVADAQNGPNGYRCDLALQRLRYYFPGEYYHQKNGALAEKIKAFEKQENESL